MSEALDKDQTLKKIKQKLALLPEHPGCYLMKNGQGDIIYVGKAKVLKNRVRSYFSGSHDAKTQHMVGEIEDFEYIVTGSNVEALILECNLIKKHHPRYNILLKDDKTFPYIKITNEAHPRLEVTRRVVKDKAKYFGPYPNAYSAQQTKKLLDRMYPLRKCKNMPDRVCLYYHMGQCLAPCEFEVGEETNRRMVQEISRFLSGGHEQIQKELKQKMLEASDLMQFERAKELRDQIHHIDVIMQKQTANLNDAADRDVFGFYADKGWICVQILYMRNGKLLERHASMFPYYGNVYDNFLSFMAQYYSDNPALPKEILLPQGEADDAKAHDAKAHDDKAHDGEAHDGQAHDDKAAQEHGKAAGEAGEIDALDALQSWLKVKVHIPQRGLKKQLLDMANDNAKIALEEKFKLLERDEERTVKAVENLGRWLGIGPARRIEAFDNSNIQGTDAVSAMVVFVNGRAERKDYRKFKIRTVQGADDYGTMREVIRRRYERVLKERLALPDLIVIDGGRGQMAAALDVLENELGLSVPVCGLAKDAKHRTSQLLAGDPPQPVPMPRDSQEFYLLQRIQDEVHRFAVTFHRETRNKSMVASQLDAIPGIGEKRRKRLLKHFGSLKKIKEASPEDFRPLGIGDKLAGQIISALQARAADADSAREDAE